MRKSLKVFNILMVVCLLLIAGLSACFFGGVHPDPIFNIGNGFNQPVVVYFEGQNIGYIDPGESKIFYPNEVLTTTNTDLLVELRSESGLILYSRSFSWDELTDVLESINGEPYWIGN